MGAGGTVFNREKGRRGKEGGEAHVLERCLIQKRDTKVAASRKKSTLDSHGGALACIAKAFSFPALATA